MIRRPLSVSCLVAITALGLGVAVPATAGAAGISAAHQLSRAAPGPAWAVSINGSASATGKPSAWPMAGYDTGQSHWGSAESTMTPARVKIMKLNYSIPVVLPDPNTDNCERAVPPVTAGGRLFDLGADGISAYNQWTGHRLWNIPATSQYAVGMQIIGSDLVVALDDCGTMEPNTDVLVLDAATGAQAQPGFRLDNATRAGFVVTNGVLIASEYDGDTNAFWSAGYRLATGRRLWELPSWSVSQVAANGLVYGSYAGNLTAQRIGNGSLAWYLPKAVQPEALSQDGRDLFGVDSDGTLYDIRTSTGAVQWTDAGRGGTLAVTASTVYSMCAANVLCATRRWDGKALWQVTVPSSGPWMWWLPLQPIVAVGVVYVAGESFLAATGHRLVSAADGALVTAVSGGRAYGLRYDATAELWDSILSFK